MKHLIQIVMMLLFAFACNDDLNDDQNTPDNTAEPFVSGVGIPFGAAETKEIGPDGGSISSTDAVLDIIIPPQAVSSNTTFSIQPVTTLCPGGMKTYRLLPEGLTFSNPVKLIYHYSDEAISGTIPALLGIAYQGPDGVWYTFPGAVVNEASKTISIDVKHFTDWTAMEYLGIFPKIPDVPELRINETIDLSIYGQGMATEADELPPLPKSPANNPSPDQDDLFPLPVPRPFTAKWFVNGVENGNSRVGTISPGYAASHLFVYKAPAETPVDNIVSVSAEVTGLKKWTIEGGKPKVTTHNKVILFKRIKIRPDEYNYTLKIEFKDNYACGYQGQTFHDVVEMDVRVKGETVSVSNIVNQEPSVNPLTISVVGCSLTCEPGSTGVLNVTSGSGKVYPAVFEEDQWRFEVHLVHKGSNTGAVTTMACPDIDPIVAHGEPDDHTEHFRFILADSAQNVGSPPENNYGYFVKLTPK